MGRRDEGRTSGARGAALATLVLASTLLGRAASAGETELDLYERVSLAPLVVHARLETEPRRFAEFQVLEVLKGDYARSQLRVAYRLINFERPYGSEKISFTEGEEALLFLLPSRQADGSVHHADRFILFKGPDGKITLPAEGRRVWLDAARRAVEIGAIEDSRPLFRALRGLVWSENPLLVEIALHQIEKHRLADETILPALLKLVEERKGELAVRALDIIAAMLGRQADSGPALAARDHLVAMAVALADHSRDAATRRAAVRMLASEGTPAARAKLEAIAEADPSQDVRYEAAVAVYQLRGRLR